MIMSIFIIMLIMCLLIMMMTMMNFLISKNVKIKFNKISPFECGFNNITKSQFPFSLNFYLMTILFLMFDIEITIILPFYILFQVCKMKIFMLMFYYFIYLMLLSLFYEWKQNILNWLI
uniref:NADH-ubiquinone oxidoreductase chain 3 n=1 Tax=Polycentropus flavomaculatus TaxID=185640 RepID=A0A7D7AHA9_9NEOP|nr:NADH dehydrogenase subunit 3 [Polycentropus flavomaculatus]